jgi:hypothetical protein
MVSGNLPLKDLAALRATCQPAGSVLSDGFYKLYSDMAFLAFDPHSIDMLRRLAQYEIGPLPQATLLNLPFAVGAIDIFYPWRGAGKLWKAGKLASTRSCSSDERNIRAEFRAVSNGWNATEHDALQPALNEVGHARGAYEISVRISDYWEQIPSGTHRLGLQLRYNSIGCMRSMPNLDAGEFKSNTAVDLGRSDNGPVVQRFQVMRIHSLSRETYRPVLALFHPWPINLRCLRTLDLRLTTYGRNGSPAARSRHLSLLYNALNKLLNVRILNILVASRSRFNPFGGGSMLRHITMPGLERAVFSFGFLSPPLDNDSLIALDHGHDRLERLRLCLRKSQCTLALSRETILRLHIVLPSFIVLNENGGESE